MSRFEISPYVWRQAYENALNCWKAVKPYELQRGDETHERECSESRKNHTDCARSKPKRKTTIGNQQPRLEQSKVQRLSAPQAIGGDCGAVLIEYKI